MSNWPIPQFIKEWKKEHEANLKAQGIMVDGKLYVKYHTAIAHGRESFTKGFKTARRDRDSLADELVNRIRAEFNLTPKPTAPENAT